MAARVLRGKNPKEAKPTKPKVIIFGPPGVGKTWASIEFPSVYYCDIEGGANLSHYTDKLKASKAKYFGPEDGSQDYDAVLEEVITLATIEHGYKTLVIDSFSKLFNNQIAVTEEEMLKRGEKPAFGSEKKEAIRKTKKLVRWLSRLDMNCILVCHEKEKWQNSVSIGQTFDGWDKLEYELHLCLQIQKRGADRVAVVRKSRLLGFPENGPAIPWSYAEFAERYGRDIMESNATVFVGASQAQIDKFNALAGVFNLTKEQIDTRLEKEDAESLPDLSTETIAKWISAMESKIPV